MGNRGMMGIGTLIIFIAVILVAAVAAAVLISTSSSLQQRALMTGSQAEDGVSTGAEMVSVMAQDGSLGHDVESFEVMMRLNPGSEAMNLNTTVLLFDTSDNSLSMSFNSTIDSDDTFTAADTKYYLVTYVKVGSDYEPGYLNRGDIIKVKFKCYDCTGGDTGGIGENKRVRIKMIPRVGLTSLVEITTPDVITEQRVSLWP